MNAGTLAIPLGFLIVLVILLWFLIGAEGKWWLKALLMVFATSFIIIISQSLLSYLGWPTPEEPPDKFVLIWAEVEEPNARAQNPGTIYVWLYPHENGEDVAGGIFQYEPFVGAPRAYKLSYNREMHEKIETIKQLMRKTGKQYVIERRGSGGPGGEGRGEEGDGGDATGPSGGSGDGGDSSGRNDGGQYKFYELPESKLPNKK